MAREIGKNDAAQQLFGPSRYAGIENISLQPGTDAGWWTQAITLLELLQSPACLLDRGGNAVHVNAAWRAYAGHSDGVHDESGLARLIHSADRDKALSHFHAATAAFERVDFQCRLQGGAGTARWFLLSIYPAEQDGAPHCNWLCVATDIDSMKQREVELAKRASMQTDMLNVSVDCIKLISLDGALMHMNSAGCRALGVSEDSGFGMPWLSLLPEDVRSAGEEAITVARSGHFARFAGRSDLPGCRTQHWDNMLTPMIGVSGQPTSILCVSREVTAERETQEHLQRSQERLAIATHVGGLGIWDYDIQRDELHCDEHWYRIMGRTNLPPIRSIGEFRPFIHPDDVERATDVVQTANELMEADGDYAITYRIIRPDGDIRWVRSAACLQHVDGIPFRAVGFVVDITDARRGELALREANRRLQEERQSLTRQSLEDPLTGIANRRCLDAELARICDRGGQDDTVRCVGMIDVDHFKAYNDRYGHIAGDEVLRRIAGALQSVARKSDLVARYGGEEFAFVLAETHDPVPMLDRLLAVVAELAIPHEGSPTGRLTISCGCIVLRQCALPPDQILRRSDAALYRAKAEGRNRYVIRTGNASKGDAD